ncbi:hypothetical protein ACFFOM_02935 [Microlunatus capsulatus]|uniref:Uncharacterized membrane protein YhaH (DUF805 family) n=1 Tax=Microlunatus capsulatus TaxID=99117 RepID=A0ABS4Z4Z6_9ACTN|nr:hypothetical protein [Microlunatus capsulatus]MBP2415318.1 uncharacterized membrane protein YhaH (DUF805 family) [Microlunatus capsulatus]
MTSADRRLERRLRLLLRCYPQRWRRHHEDEVVAVLLDQAEPADRSTVSLSTVADLVGHGAEDRVDGVLRWVPTRLRDQVAACALVVGAALGLLMLAAEVIGARSRPPMEEVANYGHYFLSGPFLTIGVGLYLAFMTAALLVVRGHGGLARLLLVAALAYVAWMSSLWSGPYPTPRPLVLALFAGLALLAALATLRPSRRAARGMVGYGAALLTALLLGVLVTKPVLGWSIGTMTTSGNIAFSVLATVLPFVGGLALLVAGLRSRRHPGWSVAIAVAAFPVVVFCTTTSQMVNSTQAAERAWYPLYYLAVLTTVAVVHRRRNRQLPVTTS